MMLHLPVDMWDHTFRFLDSSDLVSASMVCKSFLSIARACKTPSRVPLFAGLSKKRLDQTRKLWPHLSFAETIRVPSLFGDCPVTCARPDGSHLYAGCSNGVLAKLDMDTHAVQWAFGFGAGANRWQIEVAPECIFTGDTSGQVRKIGKSMGAVEWVCDFDSDVNSLAHSDGFLYVGGADGSVTKINASGQVLWCHWDETEVVQVALGKTALFYANNWGSIQTLDKDHGTQLFVKGAHGPSQCIPLPPTVLLTGQNAMVATAERCEVCCPSFPVCDPDDPDCVPRTFLYRQNLLSGRVAWEVEVEATVDCVDVDGSRIFFACSSCEIHHVDLATGARVWTWRLPEESIVHDVHAHGMHLYACDSTGAVHKMVL
jgi:outer membrane protein assembly factor BamB